MGKKLFISVFGLTVVVIGTVLLGPHLVNWNDYKPEIAAQVKSLTGRDITIGGDLGMRIFPAPTLTVRDFRLANVAGASAPDMVRLEALQVRVALLPLLGGEVQVESVRLVNPVIYLEKLPDGSANWEFDAPDAVNAKGGLGKPSALATREAVPESSKSVGVVGAQVSLDHFEVTNATLIYRELGANASITSEQKVEGLDATLRAKTLSGPFEAKGKVNFQGMTLSFEVSSGTIIEGRTVPLNVAVFAPGNSRLGFSGAITALETAPHYKGKVNATGDNLAELLQGATGGGAAPGILAQPFSLTVQADASQTSVMLNEIEFSLGTNRIDGSALATLGDAITFEVDVKAGKVDLDQILKAAGAAPADNTKAEGVSKSPPKVTSAGSNKKAAGGGIQLPQNISGKVAVQVAALTYKGGQISDLELAADLKDGVLNVSKATAMAPGVTDVSLTGTATTKDGNLAFDGNTFVVISDPSGLANWLGAKVPDGIAGRVRKISYKSKVALTSESLTLSGIDVGVDRSRISGGVTLALRKRLSFGASINVDTLNLDAYLNGGSSKKAAASATPASAKTKSSGASISEVAGAWAALRALNDFDANANFKVGVLSYGGKSYRDIRFDGTLYSGELKIREAKLGSFGGASGAIKGTLNGFGGVPELSNVTFNAKAADVAKLARQLGNADVPKGIGAAKVSGSVNGSLLKPKLSIKADAMGGKTAVEGSFSLLPIGFGFDGIIKTTHPKPTKVFSAMGLDYRPKGPIAAMDLGFNLKSDGKTHEVTNISGTLDKTTLAGVATITTGGAKTGISANLQAGDLNIEHFLPREGKTKKSASFRQRLRRGLKPGVVLASMGVNTYEPVAELAQASRANRRWSRDVIGLSVLNTINADVTLTAKSIRYAKHKLTNADVHATVANGVLNADRIKGKIYGGPVSGTAKVRAKGAPTMDVKLNLNDLNVAQVMKAVAGQKGVKGALKFNMAFTANGNSQAKLVSSLNGKGGLSITGLDVKQGGKGSALSGVVGLVAAMNQFSQLGAGAKSSGLADVNTRFRIKKGVAQLREAAITSAMGSGNAEGSIDIAAWAMDISGLLTVEPNLVTSLLSKGRIGRQEVPFKLKGVLDDPKVKIGVRKAAPAAGTEQTAPEAAKDPRQILLEQMLNVPGSEQQIEQKKKKKKKNKKKQNQQTQPAPQKIKPEDIIIKGIMDGLLKNKP